MLSSMPFTPLAFAITLAVISQGCTQGNERLAEKARIEGSEQAKATLQAQLDAQAQLIEKARAEGRAVAQAELQVQLDSQSQLIEKARAEGKAVAQAQLQVQLDAQAQLIEKARAEGKAVAQAELQAQIENLELVVQRARAEGRAQAEAEITAGNANLAAKAQTMEADLATRQLFYQAIKGSYEGDFATERGDFKVRVTLVPSLPSSSYNRTRQLEEIVSDLNNLSFHAQILQWNPANPLSAVGCRVENIRPDLIKGEINIASSSCPNLYKLQIADPEIDKTVEAERRARSDQSSPPREAEVARATASAIIQGKINELAHIHGEIHPSTNAAIYTLSVKRTSSK